MVKITDKVFGFNLLKKLLDSSIKSSDSLLVDLNHMLGRNAIRSLPIFFFDDKVKLNECLMTPVNHEHYPDGLYINTKNMIGKQAHFHTLIDNDDKKSQKIVIDKITEIEPEDVYKELTPGRIYHNHFTRQEFQWDAKRKKIIKIKEAPEMLSGDKSVSLQRRVNNFLDATSSEDVTMDYKVRNKALLMKVLLLLYSNKMEIDEVLHTVSDIYGNTPGNPSKIIGEVVVEIAAMSRLFDSDFIQLTEDELQELWDKVYGIEEEPSSVFKRLQKNKKK